MMKLNLGCGNDAMDDFVNVDLRPHAGAIQADAMRLPFRDDTFDELYVSHLIEHLPDSLGFMSELYRVARAGARCILRVPHGASDGAWEDPTHVRPYFPGSFGYFGQPNYWRADYAYRADWSFEALELKVREKITMADLRERRNVVVEMIATTRCVKPAREPKKEPGSSGPAVTLTLLG